MSHKHLPPGGFGENACPLPRALSVPLKPGAQASGEKASPLGLPTSSALSNTPGPSYFQDFTGNSLPSRPPWGVPSEVMEPFGCHCCGCLAQEANNQFRRSRCELLKSVNCCLWSPDIFWSCPILMTTKMTPGGTSLVVQWKGRFNSWLGNYDLAWWVVRLNKQLNKN